MVVPMIAPIFQMVNTSDDVEYRAKVEEVIFEKTSTLMDDMCESHRMNKEQPVSQPS